MSLVGLRVAGKKLLLTVSAVWLDIPGSPANIARGIRRTLIPEGAGGPALPPRASGNRADSAGDLLLRLPGHDVEVPRGLLPRFGARLAALRAADDRHGGDLPAAHGAAPGAYLVARPADPARRDAGAEQRGVRRRAAAHADRRGGDHRLPVADHRRGRR